MVGLNSNKKKVQQLNKKKTISDTDQIKTGQNEYKTKGKNIVALTGPQRHEATKQKRKKVHEEAVLPKEVPIKV